MVFGIFGKAYAGIEKKYYGLMNWFEDKKIPLYKLNDFFEEKGIPGLPALLGIIALIIGILVFSLFLFSSTPLKLTVSILDEQRNPLQEVELSINDEQGKQVFSETISNGEIIELKDLKKNSKLELAAVKEGYKEAQQILSIGNKEEAVRIILGKERKLITVKFNVLDSQTKSLIPNATGIARFAEAEIPVNAQNGTIELIGVPEGEKIELELSAENYLSLSEVKQFDSNQLTAIELEPSETEKTGKTSLVITAKDRQSKEALSNYRIQVFDNLTGEQLADDTSNTEIFSKKIDKGKTIRIIVSLEGYSKYDSLDEEKIITLRGEEFEWEIELSKGSAKTKVNAIEKESKLPLSGIKVSLFNSEGELIDSNTTGFDAIVEFNDLNADANYFIASSSSVHLPKRIKFNASKAKELELELERISKTNSVALSILVFDEKNNSVENALIRILEETINGAMPLGFEEIRTDITGFATATVPTGKKLLIIAGKGAQTAEESIATEALKQNEVRIQFNGTIGLIGINILDENGAILKEGTVTIESENGTVLFNGEIPNESLFVDAGESKWLGIKVKKIDGTTYSDQVPIEKGKPIEFRLGAKQVFGTKPQINFLRIEDSEGKEAVGITQEKEYYLVFETLWPKGSYESGAHIRIGKDADKFAESQGIGIIDYLADAKNSFFGKSYHFPNNQGIDKKNIGKRGKQNKLLELYFDAQADQRIIKAKIKSGIGLKEKEIEVHFRAWINANGNYYREPNDSELETTEGNSKKNSLYAETQIQTIKVFDALPNCKAGICIETSFVDSSERESSEKEFIGLLEKPSALQLNISSLIRDSALAIKAQTTPQEPGVLFLGNQVQNFSQFIDNQNKDTGIEIKDIIVRKGESIPIRIFFRPSKTGTGYIRLQVIAKNDSISKEFYFPITQEKKFSAELQKTIGMGEEQIIELKDTESNSPITNAEIILSDTREKTIQTILGTNTIGKGANGKYSIKGNLSPQAYNLLISAKEYETQKVLFEVVNTQAMEIPKETIILIPRAQNIEEAIIQIKNKLNFEITGIGIETANQTNSEFAISASVPQLLQKNQSSNIKAAATYSGKKERDHGEADLIIRGIVGEKFAIEAKTRLIMEYNKEFSNECLEFLPEKLIAPLPGIIGSSKQLEFKAANNCPIDLELLPEIKSQNPDDTIRINANPIRIRKKESAQIRVDIINETQRIIPRTETISYNIEYQSDALAKTLPIDIILYNPVYSIETNDNIMIYLAQGAKEKEAVSSAPLFIRNIGIEDLHNIEITVNSQNWQGVQLEILPKFPIETLKKRTSVSPPIMLIATTRQSKSQNVIAEVNIEALVGKQKIQIRKTALWINVSAQNCATAIPSSDPILFTSTQAGTSALEQTVQIRNNCSEEIRVIGIEPNKFGGNNLTLLPLEETTILPLQQAKFKVLLQPEQKGKNTGFAQINAVLVRSGKITQTQRIGMEAEIGTEETREGKTTDSIETRLCKEKPGDSQENTMVKFPKIALNNDCQNGYCDAETLAKFLDKKLFEKIREAKNMLYQKNKDIRNTNCDQTKNYCLFDSLGAQSKPLTIYLQNDSLTTEILESEFQKGALTQFDSEYLTGSIESISQTGYGNRVFVEPNIKGCGKYTLKLNGSIKASNYDLLEEPMNLYIELLSADKTLEECNPTKIQNISNYLPLDSSYTYNTRKGTLMGMIESQKETEELAKSIAKELFGKEDRYSNTISTNKLKIELSQLDNAFMELETTEPKGSDNSPEAKTIKLAIEKTLLQNVTEETKKKIIQEATNNIRALRNGEIKGCISKDNKKIRFETTEGKGIGEGKFGEIGIIGCGTEKPSQKAVLNLLGNSTNCCELKTASKVSYSIKPSILTDKTELGSGIKDDYLKHNDKDEKILAGSSLELKLNASTNNFENSFKFCAETTQTAFESNKKIVAIEAQADNSSERAVKEIELKACAINPIELYKRLHEKSDGEFIATIAWKGAPDTITASQIEAALMKSGFHDARNESVKTEEKILPAGKIAAEQLKNTKMKAIGLYSAACLATCGFCEGIKGPGLFATALDCVVFTCGIPAAIGTMKAQTYSEDSIEAVLRTGKYFGSFLNITDYDSDEYRRQGEELGKGNVPQESYLEEIGIGAASGAIGSFVGARVGTTINFSQSVRQRIGERLAKTILQPLERQITAPPGLAPGAAATNPSAEMRRILAERIADNLPRGRTKIAENTIENALKKATEELSSQSLLFDLPDNFEGLKTALDTAVKERITKIGEETISIYPDQIQIGGQITTFTDLTQAKQAWSQSLARDIIEEAERLKGEPAFATRLTELNNITTHPNLTDEVFKGMQKAGTTLEEPALKDMTKGFAGIAGHGTADDLYEQLAKNVVTKNPWTSKNLGMALNPATNVYETKIIREINLTNIVQTGSTPQKVNQVASNLAQRIATQLKENKITLSAAQTKNLTDNLAQQMTTAGTDTIGKTQVKAIVEDAIQPILRPAQRDALRAGLRQKVVKEVFSSTATARAGEEAKSLTARARRTFRTSRLVRGILCGAAANAAGTIAYNQYLKNTDWISAPFTNSKEPIADGQKTEFKKGLTYKFIVQKTAKGQEIIPTQATDLKQVSGKAIPIEDCDGKPEEKELIAASASTSGTIANAEACEKVIPTINKYVNMHSELTENGGLRLATAIALQESNCNPNSDNVGGKGIFQLTGPLAEKAGEDKEKQIQVAVGELADRLNQALKANYKGEEALELAAFGYNRGAGAEARAIEELKQEANSMEEAMNIACKETASQKNLRLLKKTKEEFCGEGYGANYAIAVLDRYNSMEETPKTA